MKQNSIYFLDFIEGYDDDRVNIRADRMKNLKVWGDHPEIIALCGYLNINIDLYTPSGIRKMSFDEDNAKTNTKTIEISYHQNNHYCSVRKLEDTTISKAIYEQITTLESLMIDDDDKKKATPLTKLISRNKCSPSGNQPSKYEPGKKSQKITTDKAKTSSPIVEESQKITTDKAKTSNPIVEDTKLQNIAPQIQKPSKNNSKKLQMTTGKSKAKTKAKAKANDND